MRATNTPKPFDLAQNLTLLIALVVHSFLLISMLSSIRLVHALYKFQMVNFSFSRFRGSIRLFLSFNFRV